MIISLSAIWAWQLAEKLAAESNLLLHFTACCLTASFSDWILLKGNFNERSNFDWRRTSISMLATDVGDEICWRQLWDVGDGFGRFCHQHPLSFSSSVGHQHPKDAPISKFCYQHPKIVPNIKSSTSTCHQHLFTHEGQFQRINLKPNLRRLVWVEFWALNFSTILR